MIGIASQIFLEAAIGVIQQFTLDGQANDILEGADLPQIREHRDFLQRRLAEAMRLTL
jgi:hypothetical protein